MDDNNINNNTYRATRNLNTALESPEYKVEDTLDVNIKDVDNNNYIREGIINNTTQPNNINNNSFISDDIATGVGEGIANDNSVILTTNTDEVKSTYTPTGSPKKKKEPFSVPTELKLLIIMVIILLIFIFFMPKIYNFFKSIELFFFNR